MLPRLKGSRRETKDEMAVTRATSLVSAVGLELELKFKGTDSTSNNEKKAVVGMGVGVEVKQNLKSKNQNLSLTLTPTKPSWVVRTESNVRKEIRKKPDPPCVVCQGTGRVDCYHCSGKGRTNYAYLAILPKGEWPKWCRTCGGSGLSYCSRCLGTGEYRYVMGFHFMKMGSGDTNDQLEHHSLGNPGPHNSAHSST